MIRTPDSFIVPKRNNPNFSLFAATWRYTGCERRKLVLTIILFVIGNVVLMFEPYVLSLLLPTLQTGGAGVLGCVFFLVLSSRGKRSRAAEDRGRGSRCSRSILCPVVYSASSCSSSCALALRTASP